MYEQTHYRYYDIKQNACLDMIQYMKELGMELKEIKEILVPEMVQGSLAVVIWYAGKFLYWMDILVKVI